MADVPAWIGAVGTVGTLTTGVILFAGQLSDRRKRHASLVAVWTESSANGGREFRLNIKNDGGQPIYDCRLDSVLRLSLPGNSPEEPTDLHSELHVAYGVIAPGVHVANVSFLRVDRVGASVDLDDLVNRGLRFRLSFTDCEGRTWFRDQRGRLRRMRSRKPLGDPAPEK